MNGRRFFDICSLARLRALPLTLNTDSSDRWGQIATRTANLKKGGSNLGGCAVAVVAVFSTVVGILFTILGVLSQTTIISLVSAILVIIYIIVYLVGAAKLSKAVGNGNETGARVVTLTRQVAGALVFYIFVTGGWTVLGDGPMPVQMVLANLLLPMCAVIPSLLLLRFIRRSFERQGARSKSRASKKRAGAKSSASVSPSTDFAKSSTNGKSTATDV